MGRKEEKCRRPEDLLLFEKNEISCEWLEAIITELYWVLMNIAEYMLDESHIMMDPEYIYIDYDSRKLYFIVYPLFEENIQNGLTSLAEYIMDKVDHTDSRAVMRAYSLYKTVKADNFTITSLEDVYKIGNDSIGNSHYEDTRVEKVKYSAQKDELIDYYGTNKEKEFYNETVEASSRVQVNPGQSIINKLKNVFTRNTASKTKDIDCPDFIKPLPQSCIVGTDGNQTKEQMTNNYLSNSDSDTTLESSYGKTVLLSETMQSEKGVRGHVLKNQSTGQSFSLDKLPATIGKLPECVDIVLKEPSISKIHARISEENGKICISDLGSTNGTFLNGLILDDNEAVPLEENDEITLGTVGLIYL